VTGVRRALRVRAALTSLSANAGAGWQRVRRTAARPRSVVAGQALWVLSLTFVSLPVPVASVDFVSDRFDASWVIGMILAVRDHLQWGTQIIWTYGPLGYIDHPVYVFFRQWLIAVMATVLIQLGLFAALAVLLRMWKTPLWAWIVLGGLAVAPSAVIGTPDLMGLFLGMLLAVIALETGRGRRVPPAIAAGAGAVLAITALIKTTALLSGGVVIAIFVVCAILQHRRRVALASPLAFVGTFLVAWIVTGQALADIPAYVHGTLEFSAGYSAGMSLVTPPGGDALPAGLGGLFVVALAIGALLLWRHRAWSGVRLLVLLLPVVALNFKEGFVRADTGHEFLFFSVVTLAAGVLVAAAAARRMPELRALLLPASCISLGLAASFLIAVTGGEMPLLQVTGTVGEYSTAWSLLTSSEARDAQAASTLSQARNYYDLPPAAVAYLASGSVDILPWDIAIAYAYGLHWDPSPVLEGYSAYTAYLDDQDAAQLASASAPATVVVVNGSIDGRYPAFDQPATFRALLQGYAADTVVGGQYLILSRAANSPGERASVTTAPGQGAGTTCAPMGADIPVPQRPGQYTFASLELRYSLHGTIKDAFYKPADALIQFTVGGNSPQLTAPYKFIPATAADGLFVSGYLPTVGDLQDAFTGVVTQPIEAIRVTSPNPGDYDRDVCASFYTIPVNSQP